MAESDVTDNPTLFGVRGLVAAWSTSAAAFAGFSMLLPVVPWAIAEEGGSDTVAGSVTAVFMFTTVLT
ncbi:MAG: MFS transporter, partial [Rhodococcus sp. (in: high G+C Gram-positive bacteria)]